MLLCCILSCPYVEHTRHSCTRAMLTILRAVTLCSGAQKARPELSAGALKTCQAMCVQGQFSQQDAEECWTQLMYSLRSVVKVRRCCQYPPCK